MILVRMFSPPTPPTHRNSSLQVEISSSGRKRLTKDNDQQQHHIAASHLLKKIRFYLRNRRLEVFILIWSVRYSHIDLTVWNQSFMPGGKIIMIYALKETGKFSVLA